MHAKTRTDELLRQLSTSVVPVEDATHAATRRERVIERVAGLVHEMPAKLERRRRLARMATLASAAALVLVAGFAVTRPRSRAQLFSEPSAKSSAVLALQGSVQVIRPPTEMAAPPLERVSVGSDDEVVTAAEGRARAWLASGTEVDIDPQSRVRLVGDRAGSSSKARTVEGGNEAVVLGAGRVTLRVPKLGPQRTFAVQTPEATVVVHGTAFSVERRATPDDAPRTTVDVTEGSVAVRRDGTEILLHAGDRWSSGSAVAREREVEPKVEPATKPNPPTKRTVIGTAKGAELSEKSSSLAAENRLLQAAMAARQQGDARRAVQLASELLTRFPASPLAEEALVERMRALFSAGGAPAAAAEARSYLNDYPQGFARQEAARILASGSR
jgi:ferric-dicitrate binding protein FerR (iron transport regulator)